MNKIVVMGVAGCGKSTLASGMALLLGCRLIEGDDHHRPESQKKMRNGVPLADADREPWLDRLGELMAQTRGDVVVTCSALKRRYRERLRSWVPALKFVYVDIDPDQAASRVACRAGHLFPASLVASQFDALEPPIGEPGVLSVPAALAPQAQLDAVARWLARDKEVA